MTLVEQPRVENDLAVGDRDQIGRNVCAQIAGIQFGDRKGGQRPAAGGLGKLGRAFEQPCMDIEHVAGISLAPRRLAGEERDLAMRGGVLGHVVDDDQRVLAAIAEVFRHREAGKRRDPLQTRSSRRARDDEDAAFRRAVGLNCVDDPLDRGRLLTDCDVDADDVAGSSD